MPTFFYRAVGKDGGVVNGVVEESTDRAAAVKLQDMGLVPLHLGTRRSRRFWDVEINWRPGGIGARDLMFFTQELSTLVNSGLPLDRSLAICKELSGKKKLQNLADEILQDLKRGKTLADSLAAHPKVFSKLYVNMVRAGEAGGALPLVLERLVEFQQSADELRSYLVSSLIYPALLTLVGAASIVVLLNYVIPRFAEIFDEAGRALPLPTQILLGVSGFTRGYWWVFLLVLGGLGVGFSRLLANPGGRMWWDGLKLRTAGIGEILKKVEMARIARTLGTLVHNAVPLVQALGIVREISGNRVIARAIRAVAEGVKRGEGVARPMRQAGVFPPLAVHLIEVGEETGRLDTMLLRLAEVYDKDVRAAVKNFIALFEPVMILVMGLVIGGIVISTVLAMVSINELPV